MTQPSSSPSLGCSRRLSELLDEKQEPFFLDIHLLEKGCSPRLFEPYSTAMCWPRSQTRLPSRLTMKGSLSKRPAGVLRLLLTKILHGTAAAAAKWKPAAPLDWHRTDQEKKKKKPSCSPRSGRFHAVEDGMGKVEEEEDEEDSRQLSPVSVLQHPFETSPACGHKAMDVLRNLLEAAYNPALLAQLSEPNELTKDATSMDKKGKGPHKATSAAYWEGHETELAKVTDMAASEIAEPRPKPGDVQKLRRDVGADVEAALFAELTDELVMELSGMVHGTGSWSS